MFKKFSFRGVLLGFKKYWTLALAIVLICSFVGIILSFSNSEKNTEEINLDVEHTAYLTYHIVDKDGDETLSYENKVYDAVQVAAILYDSSVQYEIINKACENFTKEEISSYLNIPISDVATPQMFVGNLVINTATGSSLINLSIKSTDYDFSYAILDYYSDYVKNNMERFISNDAACVPINEIKVVSSDNSANDNGLLNMEIGGVKLLVVMITLGIILSIIVIAGVVLFFPIVESVKSFEELGFSVLSEKFFSKRYSPYFTKDIVQHIIKNEAVSTIAICSTLTDKKSKLRTKKVTDFLNSADLTGVKFSLVEGACTDYEVFSMLTDFDSVIFVESVGRTKYNEIEKTLSLFGKFDKKISGVILF